MVCRFDEKHVAIARIFVERGSMSTVKVFLRGKFLPVINRVVVVVDYFKSIFNIFGHEILYCAYPSNTKS